MVARVAAPEGLQDLTRPGRGRLRAGVGELAAVASKGSDMLRKLIALISICCAMLGGCELDGWSIPDAEDTEPLTSAILNGDKAAQRSLAYKARAQEMCVSLVNALKNMGAFTPKDPKYEARVPAIHCAPAGTDAKDREKWVTFAFTKAEVMDLCSRWDGIGMLSRALTEEMGRQATALLGSNSGKQWMCMSETEWETVWVKATHITDAANPDPAWLEDEEQRRIFDRAALIGIAMMSGYLLTAEVIALIPEVAEALGAIDAVGAFCPKASGKGECDPQSPFYEPPSNGGDTP